MLCSSTNLLFGENIDPEIGQNALSHSDCGIFKSRIFPGQIDEIASLKMKVDWNIFGWAWSKKSDQSSLWTLKSTAPQERTGGTDFLHAVTIPHKLKDD